MATGKHLIQFAYCKDELCGRKLGWKYILAEREDQKYKEGMVVLERCLIMPIKKKQQVEITTQ